MQVRLYRFYHLDIFYKCLSGDKDSDEGVSKILNVSSGGIRFTIEPTINIGQRAEVTVEWPALIDNKCLMKWSSRDGWYGAIRAVRRLRSSTMSFGLAHRRPSLS